MVSHVQNLLFSYGANQDINNIGHVETSREEALKYNQTRAKNEPTCILLSSQTNRCCHIARYAGFGSVGSLPDFPANSMTPSIDKRESNINRISGVNFLSIYLPSAMYMTAIIVIVLILEEICGESQSVNSLVYVMQGNLV